VEHRHLVAEVGAESCGRLWREGDLGDEHDRGAPLGERRPEELDVHERLPGPGDALEEEGRLRPVERGHEPAQGGALVLGRLERGRLGWRPVCERVAELLLVDQLDEPLPLETADDATAEPLSRHEVRQLRFASRGLEQLVRFSLPGRAPEQRLALRQVLEMAHDPHGPTRLHVRLGGGERTVLEHACCLERADLGPDRAHPERAPQGAHGLRALPTRHRLGEPPLPRTEVGARVAAEAQVVARDVREDGGEGGADGEAERRDVVVGHPAA
jgi:hypothetical protein